MNEKVYMHGIGYGKKDYYSPKEQRLVLAKILASNALLSRRLLGMSESYGFNGLDYISLCDYEKKEELSEGRKSYNAYHSYIKNSVALAFEKEKICDKIIQPELVENCSLTKHGYRFMRDAGLFEGKRFSDMPDEVQIKDRLSMDNLSYISFPVASFLDYHSMKKNNKKIDLLLQEIYELNSMLLDYGKDIDIYDIQSGYELNEENIKKLILR